MNCWKMVFLHILDENSFHNFFSLFSQSS
jgi:hypothetical protein